MDKPSLLLSQDKYGRLFQLMNQSLPVLVGIFIFFNPYPHVTALKEISFYGSVLILLTLLSLRKTHFSLRTPLSIPFLVFIIWSFYGLFFALNKSNTIHDLYAHLIKYVIFFYMLFNFFDTKKRLIILIWTIIISAAIYSAGMILYFYVMLAEPLSTKLGLFMDEIPSNIVGISTLFAILLSLYQLSKEKIGYRKIILTICLGTTAIATLATQTMGALLAMFVSLILSFWKNKKFSVLLFLFLAAAIMILPVKNVLKPDNMRQKIRDDGRINIWYSFAEMVKDHPITGIGFGMQTYSDEGLLEKYNARVPVEYRLREPHKAPHNLLVDVAVRTGLIGFVLFLYIILEFSWLSLRIIKSGKDDFIRHWGLCFLAAFVAIFIQGMFENTLSGPPAIILYTIWGVMAILWRLNTEPDISTPRAAIN